MTMYYQKHDKAWGGEGIVTTINSAIIEAQEQ